MIELLILFTYNVGYSFLSIITFGILAIYEAFNNGFAIGMLLEFVGKMHGIGIVILEILPHGIIEIPALLISASIGLRIGHIWWSGDWWSRYWWDETMIGINFWNKVLYKMDSSDVSISGIYRIILKPRIVELFRSVNSPQNYLDPSDNAIGSIPKVFELRYGCIR